METKRYVLMSSVCLLLLVSLLGCGRKDENDVLSDREVVGKQVPGDRISSEFSSSDSMSAEKIVLKVGPHRFNEDDFYAWYAIRNNIGSVQDAKKQFFALSESEKRRQFESFVDEVLIGVAAIERGYDKYPEVKSMFKINKLMLAMGKMLEQEGSIPQVDETAIRELYGEALEALQKDIEANDGTYSHYAKTRFAQLFGLPALQYMIDQRVTLWKIKTNSSSEADRVMARFYQEKSQNGGDSKAAFRAIAREIMGPAYVERVSTSVLLKEIDKLREELMTAGDEEEKKNIQNKILLLSEEYNTVLYQPKNADPRKVRVGDDVYLFFVPKDKELSIVSWDELSPVFKTALESAYRNWKTTEILDRIKASVKKNYENSIEKHFENL